MTPFSNEEPQLGTLGGRLRAVRIWRGLTAVDAARAVGVSKTSWHLWESDQVNRPKIEILAKFSSVAEITLDWLVNCSGEGPDLTKKPPVKSNNSVAQFDPVIQALMVRLPKPGETWTAAQRRLWLQALEVNIDLVYPVKQEVTETEAIKKTTSTTRP